MNNGIKILSDYEQAEADYADKRIAELKALKESFFNLMSEARKHTTVSQFAYEDAVIAMEESLDDLLYSDFADAVEVSGSLEELPKSRFYRNWLNRMGTVRENKVAAETTGEMFLDALNKATVAGGVQ